MTESTQELIENGLRGHPLENLIDGWTFHVDEPSSNVYVIEGVNKQGGKIKEFGGDPQKVLNNCLRKAEQFNSRQRFFAKFKNLLFK
jgi:hypothetical protein